VKKVFKKGYLITPQYTNWFNGATIALIMSEPYEKLRPSGISQTYASILWLNGPRTGVQYEEQLDTFKKLG